MTETAVNRVAIYGGSFDPPHLGHLAVARAILVSFPIDEFLFMPAFHAPHKLRLKPTAAFDRYTMLCLATADEPSFKVSRMEIESPAKPFTVETLARLKAARPEDRISFVMGADSWDEITTWRDWENRLDRLTTTSPSTKWHGIWQRLYTTRVRTTRCCGDTLWAR